MTDRCRFAPSPTGQLHVGGARTALFNFLYARSVDDGRFVLRIEDTDQVRSSRQSEDNIKADLRWLGILWDEGPEQGGPGAPYRQSERLEIYQRYIQELLDSGKAYHAYETKAELDALREQAQKAKTSFRYRYREYSEEDLARFEAEGRTPLVRLRTHGVPVTFVDTILGEVTVHAGDIDDFVIQKTDGFPTYHFGVVVDDHHMEVTQVLRAQEHLMNTARHILLYEALGWAPPRHGHMPLIFSMGGGKMSKRDKAKAARAAARAAGLKAPELAPLTGLDEQLLVRFLKKKTDEVSIAAAVAAAVGAELPEIDVVDFRKAGYLPEALVNFLALLGWSAGNDQEIFTQEQLTEAFSMDRIGKTAARFDRDKLRWMNGMYVREASVGRLLEALNDYLGYNPDSPLASADADRLTAILTLYKERFTTYRELEDATSYLFAAPTEWGPAKAIKKHLLKGGGLDRLARAGQVLESVSDWNEVALEAAFEEVAQAEYEGKAGKLAQPVRVAVCGGPVSPPIFGTLALLDKSDVLARVAACLAHHRDS